MLAPKIDLFLWPGNGSRPSGGWPLGREHVLPPSLSHAADSLADSVGTSDADYVLLWSGGVELPREELLAELVGSGADVMHAGLKRGLGSVFEDLNSIIQDWSMLNTSDDRPATSWRLSLDACLIRRDLFRQLGGPDAAFLSMAGAGLELGYRYLKMGALVEHRPELPGASVPCASEPPAQDLYTFILRHYGRRWGGYVCLRRGARRVAGLSEWRALRRAKLACAGVPAPMEEAHPVWYGVAPRDSDNLSRMPVSAIIPTLGRYPYLPDALNSLRRQTVKPREVIVVDQNPAESRRPQTYEGYEDLNLKVIWQDKRGQSLARNTGVAEVTSPYVFLFDDDSIAHDDLIESHLRLLVDGRCQVSTGVSYPPTDGYQLPPSFRYPRLAQTFDTGNSLLPVSLIKQLGGLDRNYDFGPGTDVDFGTRLYLSGQRIVHNPYAARVHFKAPMGGLRVHGAHKYNTDAGLFNAFPAITQSYYGLRYLSRRQRRERVLLQFVTSKFSNELRSQSNKARKVKKIIVFGLTCLLLPLKWYRSYSQARNLLERGARLADFEPNKGSALNGTT